MASDTLCVLHQFPHSHYNEKARWGLDWKGVAHVRESYLPGPHAAWMLRLSGQTATPVLVLDGEVVAGSARILDTLERRWPARPLYPDDPELRRRAFAIQERFDTEVGPAVRTAVFSVLIQEPDYLRALFARHKSRPVRLLYRVSFPIVKPVIARVNGATDARGVERGLEVAQQALDFVAKEAERTGQLVGDAFGVADLCCAALLAPIVSPPHPDMALPEPMPGRVQELLARWSHHPGAHWVREQYRRHRPPSGSIDG